MNRVINKTRYINYVSILKLLSFLLIIYLISSRFFQKHIVFALRLLCCKVPTNYVKLLTFFFLKRNQLTSWCIRMRCLLVSLLILAIMQNFQGQYIANFYFTKTIGLAIRTNYLTLLHGSTNDCNCNI